MLVKDGGRHNQGQDTLFVKIVCKVLQNHIKLGWKKNEIVHEERKERMSELICLSMTIAFLIAAMQKLKIW